MANDKKVWLMVCALSFLGFLVYYHLFAMQDNQHHKIVGAPRVALDFALGLGGGYLHYVLDKKYGG
ncbi:hypothetical protein [Moraxella caviae]|uniref:hypothetical protein n=1 Tax=Moraxella caviae TaxID=34060 RepID=UPI0015592803|nr:hypothetical protein [Moraxella caviae]